MREVENKIASSEAERVQQHPRDAAEHGSDWRDYVGRKITEDGKGLRDALGDAFGGLPKQLRAEIEELRADVTVSLAHHAGERTADVIDLPALPLRGARRG